MLRTSFWFTMTSSTLGLAAVVALAAPISDLLFGTSGRPTSCAPPASRSGPQMNYEQLTSLFRVEERSTAFVTASLANVLIHDQCDRLARRRGRTGISSA